MYNCIDVRSIQHNKGEKYSYATEVSEVTCILERLYIYPLLLQLRANSRLSERMIRKKNVGS